MSKPEDKSMIDIHFTAWLDRTFEPESYKAAAPYLEDIPKDFDEALSKYIEDVQQIAYYAGFVEGVKLMQECSTEYQKTTAE